MLKKFIIPFFVLLVPGIALSQPDPAEFHLIFGNPDGSPLHVGIGELIEVPMWGRTPIGQDTVTFMYNSLTAMGTVISEQNGGECPDTFAIFGIDENCPSPPQSPYMIRFGPRFYTDGDTAYICSFLMTTVDNPDYLGQTLCPFMNGCHSTIWGMQDGVRQVAPTMTFGCLYFAYLEFVPGDANGNGEVNGVDVAYLVNYLKGFGPPPPEPELQADANGNCQVNGVDVTYLVNYLKGLGPAPIRGDCR